MSLPPPAHAPHRVLVVEDDRDARENLRQVLELDGLTVDTAATAAEALGRSDWPEVDAVVLDRLLPDADTRDLLPRLRRLAPDAAVVIVTGSSDLEGAIEALRLGAADYILKPVNPDSLRLRIGRVIDQRRLARAKERSDAVVRELVEVAECMILTLRPDHTIVDFSRFAETLTGWSAIDVVGQNYLDGFVPAEDRQAVAERNRRALAGARTVASEQRVVCRDGSVRWVLENVRALRGYDGGDMLLVVQHDIHERKLAHDRLLQSERLAAIGQMVAGLAHESRNALQRSQACLEMLALKVGETPDAANLIGRIQQAQDDLQRLFEDVRSYAAPVRLERAVVDLRAVWRETWANLDAVRQGRPVSLAERGADDVPRCDVDPFRIGQVFRNIFDNALAACPDPVRIVVSYAPDRIDGKAAARLAVRDNGPGLSAEQRRKIFDPFYTTKTKGTGLGMPIVRRIIEAHGGRITVSDDDGPGAEIVLTLPRGAA